MLKQNFKMRIGTLLVYLLLPVTCLFASTESYMQTLSGKIRKGDSCTVVDEKFASFSAADWNKIQNLSVDNIISFEMRQDTPFYYRMPFSCTVLMTIKYYTSKDQATPDILKNISLTVNYDSATGKSYVALSQYKFKNAYKVVVVIDSIYSKEWGQQIPSVFRIKSQVLIERKYPFDPAFPASIKANTTAAVTDIYNRDVIENNAYQNAAEPDGYTQQAPGGPDASDPVWNKPIPDAPTPFSSSIQVSWLPVGSYEEYDFEWTYIDVKSEIGQAILAAGGPDNVTASNRDLWMRNNNTRVTVRSLTYSINLPYTEGYVLFRVRGVSYQAPPGNLRLTSAWGNDIDNKCAKEITGHEPSLNWQYSGSFAEEGKRKEVISYFDATLRNRQSVTITNSDNTAIVAETIYDNMGRPSMNILPAPAFNSALAFYPAFNKPDASSVAPYSHKNIATIGCSIQAEPMSVLSGASQYYSPSNPQKNDANLYFNKYIPDAQKYPFTVTEYTPDNTGRIRRQGGVGSAFQIGSGHETRYYYGKPAQKELDRLFGMEAGDASHYLKNMVVDPNGQISVSYMDNIGKTIATALAGEPPANVDPLASSATASTTLNQALISPKGFTVDAGNLFMQASATFLAAVTGNYTLHYTIDPLMLTQTYSSSGFCTTCFYNVMIEVRDDCGTLVGSAASTPFSGSDVSCTNTVTITSDLAVTLSKIGEYTVTYTLKLSKDVMKSQEDYYIQHNTALTQLKTFLTSELYAADLAGCYSECQTCLVKLGTQSTFTQTMKGILVQLNTEKYNNAIDLSNDFANAPTLLTWISDTYQSLYQACAAATAACYQSPCNSRLELMKADVVPGGQYALYDSNYAILEPTISVLSRYTDSSIQSVAFTDDDGKTRHISDLATVADFIKAYIKHPEWADLFVQFHIEYCAYQWCTTHTSVYGFEEQVKAVTNGYQAVTNNWFVKSNGDYTKLLDSDPFFGTPGVPNSYYTLMKSDLANLSTVLKMTVRNSANQVLPGKNIRQFIDWMLYCRPRSSTGDLDADATANTNSWANSCLVESNCRSVGLEWEMFKNYYFQLRSKYVAMERGVTNPDCATCFLGSDPVPEAAACMPLSFSVDNITQSSFVVNVYGLLSGETYDVSIDNGATYIQTAQTTASVSIAGLTAAGAYPVVVRRHCASGASISPATNVVMAAVTTTYTLTNDAGCDGSGGTFINLNGKVGDQVTLRITFSGVLERDEVPDEAGTSALMYMWSPTNSAILAQKSTESFRNDDIHNFELVADVSFTITDPTTVISAFCQAYSAIRTRPLTASITLLSVNGVPSGIQKALCTAHLAGEGVVL